MSPNCGGRVNIVVDAAQASLERSYAANASVGVFTIGTSFVGGSAVLRTVQTAAQRALARRAVARASARAVASGAVAGNLVGGQWQNVVRTVQAWDRFRIFARDIPLNATGPQYNSSVVQPMYQRIAADWPIAPYAEMLWNGYKMTQIEFQIAYSRLTPMEQMWVDSIITK